eukprot:m.245515 g.245515  ORF g.245515 m.245515 type:complete len:103 (+) comp10958_c0_seq2:433-741(+)
MYSSIFPSLTSVKKQWRPMVGFWFHVLCPGGAAVPAALAAAAGCAGAHFCFSHSILPRLSELPQQQSSAAASGLCSVQGSICLSLKAAKVNPAWRGAALSRL